MQKFTARSKRDFALRIYTGRLVSGGGLSATDVKCVKCVVVERIDILAADFTIGHLLGL